MSDNDILKVKRLTDIVEQLKRKNRQQALITKVIESISTFQDAYRVRRQRLLEINAIYRNQSYLDKNKSGWQTKLFLPLPHNAVESRTSIVHQALWGNRLSTPYTVSGMTAEDQEFAESAEALLNGTMNRIGFYETSEEGIRSTCKYGLGLYRYGWTRRNEERLWREVKRDKEGKVVRDENKRPSYHYIKKTYRINQPFVRSVDIVDHFGFDPTAKKLEPWQCDFAYEMREESQESIYEQEVRGLYDVGSYKSLGKNDPHQLNDLLGTDSKEPQIKRDEGVNGVPFNVSATRQQIVEWFGWFDIDGDGFREFIHAVICMNNKQILCAEQWLMMEYPLVEIQYSRSLHSLTPWGIVDPVVEMSYHINELFNQRGDSIKLKLNPQFLINIDKILEDHAYVSSPGAFHPFATGDEAVGNAMQVLQFQNLEYLGVTEEERLTNLFYQTVRTVDTTSAIRTSSKDTPASTIMSLMQEAQSSSSMVINGILNQHGILGSRLLKMAQLFGDEEFVIRTTGRQGLKFQTESLENILGDFDVKVTTSTFFGNKEIELQQLIQLRPLWADAQHIDIVEVDRSILENILPKKIDKIMTVASEPLSIMDEMVLFLYGQGESVKLSPQEDLASLTQKLKAHMQTKRSGVYAKFDGQTQIEFDTHLNRIENRIQELQTQQQLQAAEAVKVQQMAMGGGANPQGNMGNIGSPNMRQMMNQARPQPNNIPQGG